MPNRVLIFAFRVINEIPDTIHERDNRKKINDNRKIKQVDNLKRGGTKVTLNYSRASRRLCNWR
jgi:hypothetical protein